MHLIILSISIVLIALFCYKPKIGIYLLALLLPVIGFEITISSLSFPLIDLMAFLLMLSFSFKLLFNILFNSNSLDNLKLPLFLPFLAFLFISFLSSLYATELSYSLWYFIRWPLFLYIAYILIPYNIVRDQKTLRNTIIVATISSVVVLIFGYLSLYGQDITDSFFRIRSIALAGVFPFGQNHNLIAEFLNVGAFFILSLRFLAKDKRLKRFFDVLFIISIIAIILTFSRTGWIILALQALLYFFVYFKDRGMNKKDIVIPLLLFVILISPLFIRMNRLQSDNISSTENRLLLTEISIEAFKQKPILGYGSGYFIKLVENNVRFVAKYGEPIDSHGVLQKTLAENGIFGIISWLFIMLVIIKIFYQAIIKYSKEYPWLTPLVIGAIGGLFFQLLNTSYYKGKVWLPIVLALLAIKLLDNIYERKRNK